MVARFFSERTRTLENGILLSLGISPMQLVHSIHSTAMEPKHTCWTAEDVTTRCGITTGVVETK